MIPEETYYVKMKEAYSTQGECFYYLKWEFYDDQVMDTLLYTVYVDGTMIKEGHGFECDASIEDFASHYCLEDELEIIPSLDDLFLELV